MERNRSYRMILYYYRPRWDLAGLKFEKWGPRDWTYTTFADDGKLNLNEQVFHIGNRACIIDSLLTGRIAYPCINLHWDDILIGGLPNELTYRVAGNSGKDLDYHFNLEPLVPVILLEGMYCRTGCSGGPLFNTDGMVIGMTILGGKYSLALHLSILNKFLKILDLSEKAEDEVEDEGH